MVKVKNKRNSNLADKVRNKKNVGVQKKVLNPFEVHINREKFKVLGQKTKNDRGLPGVSRAKAMLKRKETIGYEMKVMNKNNMFLDKRIGEKNSNMSSEEKITARFTMERAKMHGAKTGKKSIYNLADDEVLTHQGQTLEEIEKFDDPRSSDEEMDDDGRRAIGGLSDQFVSEGHFGGGMLSKTENRDGAKSHKDLIEQLIAESKKRKAEKQKLKEQTLDLTEKLDTDWKDLRPLVLKKPRTEENESLIDKILGKEEKRNLDYDKMMKELRFEKRGTPSDGLKSEELLAKDQKEKLEKLEKERQERMHGLHQCNINTRANKHRSADDLDDNFDLDADNDVMISYDKEGNPLVPQHILDDYSVEKRKQPNFAEASDSDSGSDESSEGNDECDDENDEESESSVDSMKDLKESDVSDDELNTEDNNKEKAETKINSILKSKKYESSDESNDSEVESSNSDNETNSTNILKRKSPIKENEPQIKQVKIDDESKVGSIKMKSDLLKVNNEFNANEVDEQIGEKIRADLLARKQVMDKARNELPFTYEMPSKYEELQDLLIEKEPEYQSVILERLIKCHHPSLAENNKEKLSLLFAYMLQYTNNIFTELKTETQIRLAFNIFNKIAPFIYDLAQTNIMNAKKYLTEVLIEKHDDFKKNTKLVPDLDTLIFFKLVSLIFPTSDFRHPVVTPALVFMSDILTKCKINDTYSISRCLFILALILEYTSLSKRILTSSINFVRGILFYSANTTVINPVRAVPPFKFYCEESNMLVLDVDCSAMEIDTKMSCHELAAKCVDSDMKIRSLSTVVEMLKELFTNCKDLEAQECIFEPHIQFLKLIDFDMYPKDVGDKARELLKFMKESLEVKTYTPLCREKPKPKALKLYEPDVQEVFTGSKCSKLTKEQAATKKLQYKYKQEKKGALREIRRDKSYIASVKIREKIQSDNIRKEKVKQIYKDASIQQGELNQMKRKK